MTVAYFDCFSGIAGDMILGALVDLGVELSFLKKELAKLSLGGYDIKVKKVETNHITATDVSVVVTEQHRNRSLSDIIGLLNRSVLDETIKRMSMDIFHRLGVAEAKIHNVDVDSVHFHEVGAVDSIVDIVGSVIGVTTLGIDTVFCSSLPLGHGFVSCAHGLLPLPAPATVEILKGVPVYSVERNQETVTPTGAAVITTLASGFGEMPMMKIVRIGYGSGKIQSSYPNLLRVFLGQLEENHHSKGKRGKK